MPAPLADTLSPFERAFLAALPVVSTLGLAAEVGRGHGLGEALAALFSLSYEQNVPTWYASALLLLCATASAHVATTVHDTRRGFTALAALFAYMSLDEAIEIHEYASAIYAGEGALYFGWVVPAFFVVAALGLAFLPFLRALPRSTRLSFLVAGGLYVAGALVMELPLGLYTERFGDDSLGYALIDWVEETLELVGAAFFLVSVRRHGRAVAAGA